MKKIFLFTQATLMAIVGSASAVSFENGSFEGLDPGISRNFHNGRLPAGWTSTIQSPDTWNEFTNFSNNALAPSSDGGDFVHAIAWTLPGVVEGFQQSISDLVIGESYEISFEQSISNSSFADAGSGGFFQVTFGSEIQNSDQMSLPALGSTAAWVDQTLTFQASAETQDLEFRAIPTVQNLRAELVIDGVNIAQADPPDDTFPVSITPPTELTLNGQDINEGFFTIEEIMVFDIDLNPTNILPVPDPILAQIGGTDPHFLFDAPDGTKVINIVGFFDPTDPDLDPARFNYTIGSIKDDISNLAFTAFLPSDTDEFAFQWTDLGATDSLDDNTDLFSSTSLKDTLNLQGGDLSFDNGMDRLIFASPTLIGDGSAGAANQREHGTIRGGNTGGPGPGPGPGGGNGAVPEPITAALGLMGLGVLGMATRRRAA